MRELWKDLNKIPKQSTLIQCCSNCSGIFDAEGPFCGCCEISAHFWCPDWQTRKSKKYKIALVRLYLQGYRWRIKCKVYTRLRMGL